MMIIVVVVVVVMMMNLVTRSSHHYHCLRPACGSNSPQIALNTYSNTGDKYEPYWTQIHFKSETNTQ